MKPTEILGREHRVIERMLVVLERIADEAAASRTLDVAAARDALTFIRTFADQCHHGKEEARLFPAMERCGLPADVGPTAMMRQEHELGRAHVRKMFAAAEELAAGASDAKRAKDATDRFVFEARGFVELLRDHIAKEDQVLFPMADRMLSDAAQTELMGDFDHFESHDMPAGTHERMLGIADVLTRRYGVTADAAEACAHVCGCSHPAG